MKKTLFTIDYHEFSNFLNDEDINAIIQTIYKGKLKEYDYFEGKAYTTMGENEADIYAIPRAQKYSIDYLYDATLGDMNSDGVLNVLDIVSLVNIILSGEENPLGDVNEDGDINILDVVILVNIILAS